MTVYSSRLLTAVLIWVTLTICSVAQTELYRADASRPPQSNTTLPVTTIYPRNKQIAPFGYGPVTQYLPGASTQTAAAFCQQQNPFQICLSVSGGGSCGSAVPGNQLVSCGFKQKSPVNESPFAPVNCYGNPLGDGGASGLLSVGDWCLAADYMPTRLADTLYQYNDYVRLGVNRAFGGSVFELYGTDKLDRIEQNGGAGVQLSLWGYTPGYAPSQLSRAYYAVSSTLNLGWKTYCNTTPYTDSQSCLSANPGSGSCSYGVNGPNQTDCRTVVGCADNGYGEGAPFNPLQAISQNCDWNMPSGVVDSTTAPAQGQITVQKNGPANFSRSDSLASLTWSQTSSVYGPYAEISYQMTNNMNLSDTDFQEIPAIFTHAGLGRYNYFYTGSQPYNDGTGPVSRFDNGAGALYALQLPNRPGPFGTGAQAFLTEDWASSCDATETQCLTVASFSAASQDFIIQDGTDASYFGIHGFFSLTQNLNKTIVTFLFPYRFDDVIGGKTVRQWIYQLHASQKPAAMTSQKAANIRSR